MKKQKKFFSIKSSFKRELFVGLLIAAAIPGIVTCVLLVNVFRGKLQSDYEKETVNQITTVSDAFEKYINEIDEASKEIATDEKIIGNLGNRDSWDLNKGYNRLYSLTDNLRETATFDVYSTDGTCVYSTESFGKSVYMPVYWGILKVSNAHPDDFIVKKAVLNNGDDVVLRTARAITKNDECVGFVVVNIKASDIEKVLDKTYDPSNGLTILDSFYEEVYSTRTGTEEDIANLVRARRFSGESLMQKGDSVFFFVSEIGDTGLSIILGKEPVMTADITNTMWGVTLSIGAFSLLLCMAVATLISANMSAPINDMSKAMEKIQAGNLDTVIGSKREDELGHLSNQFDRMTKELKDYMELQVRQQKELNDSNIAMMHAQLNPHFLYNTLDTIKWVAKANNVPDVAKMSADLAQILRMSISEKPFVTLKEEMELVSKYVEIQQIRFGGNFTYDFELPMELEDCMVPKLIVQPIVENALIHGLKEQERGHIFVNIFEAKERVNIEVSDNGCGIDSAVSEKINTRNRENFKGHIGFYNVDTIIKLYYGEDYGIKVERMPKGGTKVYVTLPLRNQGEE